MSDSSRRFGRFTVSVDSVCTFQDQSHSVEVQNLSIGGCFFSFKSSSGEALPSLNLQIDDVVQLNIPLPSLHHTVIVESRVAWIDSDQGYGCSFERLKPLDVWSLIQFTRKPGDAFNLTSTSQSIDHQID